MSECTLWTSVLYVKCVVKLRLHPLSDPVHLSDSPGQSSDRFLINEGCFLSQLWMDDSADDNLKGLFKAKCAYCSLSLSLHLCRADTGTLSSCHSLSTYFKITIWHVINEMNAVIRLHAWGWKNQFPVSAVTQLLLLWRLLWWIFLKRLYRVCVSKCVCVRFFMLSFPVCLSELVIQSSTLSNKRGRKRKRKKEEKRDGDSWLPKWISEV